MKKLLALSLALVMLVGVMSVSVAAESAYVDLSTLATGDFSQPDGDPYALTLNGTYTHETNGSTDLDSKYLNNLLNDMSTVHLSQTIKVDQMTKYSKTTFQGDYFKLNGLFNTVVRNQRKYEGTTQNIGDYLMYTIQHRANANGTDDGSLYLIVAYSTGMNANYTPTLAYNDPVALGKKEGEEFRLTTIWNEDNSASFYVDGTLLATYTSDKALVTQKWSGSSVAYLYFGYFDSYTVLDGYETTAKMTFSDFRVTNDHVAEDDGDCTTAIKCAECGEITTAGAASHTEKLVNAKPATATENGYTGDKVCSVCEKELAKGEVIPATGTPAESTPAESTPAESTPAASTPAESTPAESTPAESTPAESTPAESTPAASTPAATTPTNPETGDAGMNAAYVAMLTVSMMAVAALMIPEIRNKLIRK